MTKRRDTQKQVKNFPSSQKKNLHEKQKFNLHKKGKWRTKESGSEGPLPVGKILHEKSLCVLVFVAFSTIPFYFYLCELVETKKQERKAGDTSVIQGAELHADLMPLHKK
jgi:hypothetical protein